MTTTQTTTRNRCHVCNVRSAATPRMTYLGMCAPCHDYAGWENTHNDDGHDDAGSGSTDCPVCMGNDPADTATPSPTITRAPSTAETMGVHVCPGCDGRLPSRAFPTRRDADGVYVRDTRMCRPCRKSGRRPGDPTPAVRASERATATAVRRTRARRAATPVAPTTPGHPDHAATARRMFADAFRTAAMVRPRAERVAS